MISRTFRTHQDANAFREELEAQGHTSVVVIGADDGVWLVTTGSTRCTRSALAVVAECIALVFAPTALFVGVWVALPNGWALA